MNRTHTRTAFPTRTTAPDSAGRHFKAAKNSMTAIALAYLVVMLTLTGLSIWLALTFSPWFFIGTAFAGGYILVLTVAVIGQRVIMNSVGKDW